MRLPQSHRYSKWVVWLPASVSALSGEVTRLTGKKPVAAIKEKAVYSKPSTPHHSPVSLEGGGKRATDPIRSLKA
ncbi:unnamed protein product [Porites lobata]|uniref:Uncharacterized protein n=1 Tax=Porites lobata TaxID=104759 RepID=A0ABN8NBI5_9CNID|nr:unnamed protein product [Porites lobata]